jgi:hypothetical protein
MRAGNSNDNLTGGGAIWVKALLPYTDAWRSDFQNSRQLEAAPLVETRIKPYQQQQTENAQRAEQTRAFRRNQIFGVLLVAALIVVYWLLHTNPRWIFPPGWWWP